MGGGGGGGFYPPSNCLLYNFVRDVAKPENVVTFLKFNGEYDFEYENDKFLP